MFENFDFLETLILLLLGALFFKEQMLVWVNKVLGNNPQDVAPPWAQQLAGGGNGGNAIGSILGLGSVNGNGTENLSYGGGGGAGGGTTSGGTGGAAEFGGGGGGSGTVSGTSSGAGARGEVRVRVIKN